MRALGAENAVWRYVMTVEVLISNPTPGITMTIKGGKFAGSLVLS